MRPDQLPYTAGWQAPDPDTVASVLADAGLNANRAANLVGVNRSTVGRWLTGEVVPTYSQWRVLLAEIDDNLS